MNDQVKVVVAVFICDTLACWAEVTDKEYPISLDDGQVFLTANTINAEIADRYTEVLMRETSNQKEDGNFASEGSFLGEAPIQVDQVDDDIAKDNQSKFGA